MNDHRDARVGNLPEVVWNQLMELANDHAVTGEQLVIEQCCLHVERVVREVTGRPDALPPAVVQFYAQELQTRISSLIEAATREL